SCMRRVNHWHTEHSCEPARCGLHDFEVHLARGVVRRHAPPSRTAHYHADLPLQSHSRSRTDKLPTQYGPYVASRRRQNAVVVPPDVVAVLPKCWVILVVSMHASVW